MPLIFKSISGRTKGEADQDYWLDVNGEVTTDLENAHQLIVRKGQPIPIEYADRYGIGKVATEENAEEKTVKKSAKAPENKSKAPSENK